MESSARTRPESPHDDSAAPPRTPLPGPPIGVLVASGAWFVVGAVALFQGVGRRAETPSGLGNGDRVGASSGVPGGILLIVAGVVVLLLTVVLVLGVGYAIYPLVVLGLGVVLGLAAYGSWGVVPVMSLLVLGTVPLATARSYAYVTAR
ncbi:hypothetical protein [Nocardioides sp.]|uniref:hypothetical protein n=1 Tax=Nocardioides sp. TaxID=35761 RepID=UPI003219976C